MDICARKDLTAQKEVQWRKSAHQEPTIQLRARRRKKSADCVLLALLPQIGAQSDASHAVSSLALSRDLPSAHARDNTEPTPPLMRLADA